VSARRHQRVLLLGPTGVEKHAAAARLAGFVSEVLGQDFRFVDFENEFLKPTLPPPRNWTTFLAQDSYSQSSLWKSAWREFAGTLTGETTILGLHATYVSGPFGLRCPIDIPAICNDFQPSLIISLIDDVQAMWRRTEVRAAGQQVQGRPSIEQLASARRADQILGDVLLNHMGGRRAKHVLCASGNSIHALMNLVFFDAKVTYLSFPISSPREMARSGDNSFVELINIAHRTAAEEMKRDHHRAFITPLAIDELPFLETLQGGGEGEIIFDGAQGRWKTSDLWGDASSPLVDLLDGPFSYPREQVDAAAGIIRTDVGWRDRRLVLQSDSLAIVCPKPPDADRVTRGVNEEIATAIAQGISCNIWQKPEWDVDDFIGKQFPEAGSMGLGQTQVLVRRFDELGAMIAASP
jgi:hypothetical protein